MIAGCPGLPYTMRGRRSSRHYSTCTFFVDVATRFIFPHFQESTNAHETLLGKQRYKQFCQWYKHTVQEYCSDNGIFTDKQFTENLATHSQHHTVAGTGAHHMNGIAKCSIGFISTWTLTMLLHAQTRWPQVLNKSFWPFALRHAINIYVNCYRGQHGIAIPPLEEFTNMPSPLQLHDLHPWGCPVYVLDKRLQDGNSTPSKWDPRAWLGIYVGHSMIHSGNVVLIHNPLTGHTTPQFHVVFDDHFQTVSPHFASLPTATTNDLFDTLWRNNQWIYDGNTPPDYLFPETIDTPTDDSPDDLPPTETLKYIDYYISDHPASPPQLPNATMLTPETTDPTRLDSLPPYPGVASLPPNPGVAYLPPNHGVAYLPLNQPWSSFLASEPRSSLPDSKSWSRSHPSTP